MKNALTVTLALVALAAFSGLAIAQEKEPQKSPSTGPATTQPSAAKNSGHATEQMITGTGIKVDAKVRSFTVISRGKQFTFSVAEMKGPLPEVGKIIDIKYQQTTLEGRGSRSTLTPRGPTSIDWRGLLPNNRPPRPHFTSATSLTFLNRATSTPRRRAPARGHQLPVLIRPSS
jgi:hypothetical protein